MSSRHDPPSSVEGSYRPPSTLHTEPSHPRDECPSQMRHDSVNAADGTLACPIPSSLVTNDPLTEYRRHHQSRYKQRLEEEAIEEIQLKKTAKEIVDAELAMRFQKEEQRHMETRMAADEEYSRQIYEQLNGAALQFTATPPTPETYAEPDEDGVRAPMRTGYTERLIDDSPIFNQRSDPNRTLLTEEIASEPRYTSYSWRWLQECMTDEEDGHLGWRLGLFLCNRRMAAIYALLSALTGAVLLTTFLRRS